jgi:hypothetical protein
VSPPRPFDRGWGLLTGLVYLLGAWAFLRATPLFEAPDENGHFAYTAVLAQHRALPTVLGSGEGVPRPPYLQSELGHHPPLYYGLLWGLLWLGRDQTLRAHAQLTPVAADRPLKFEHGFDERAPPSEEVRALRRLRGLSVLLGGLSLLFVHRLLRRAAPTDPWVARCGTLALATNPGWLATHAVLDNGNLAVCLCLAVTALAARVLARGNWGPATALGLGALAGAALWTKLTALVALVPIVAVGAWLGARDPVRRGRHLMLTLLALGVAALLICPWVLRNFELYGEPLGTAVHERAYAVSRVPSELLPAHLTQALPLGLFRSAVGSLGWNAGFAPLWVQWVVGIAALGALALAGTRRARSSTHGPSAGLIGLTALAALALVVRFNFVFGQPQARYAYAGAAGAALVLGLGAATLRRLPGGRSVLVAVGALWISGAAATWLAARERLAFVPTDPHRSLASFDLYAVGSDPTLPPLGLERRDPAPPLLSLPTVGGPYTLRLWVEGGPVFGSTYEFLGVAAAGEFPLPQVVWDYLEPGTVLHLAYRQVPDRARGEGTRDAPESPALRVQR